MTTDSIRLRDWLGWIMAAVMTLIVALGGRLWVEQDRRISEQAAHIQELERTGTPQMRAEVAALRARVDYLQQMVEMNARTVEYLSTYGGRRQDEPSRPQPRFQR